MDAHQSDTARMRLVVAAAIAILPIFVVIAQQILPYVLPDLPSLWPLFKLFDDYIMRLFFWIVSPNPAAIFVLANLVLLSVSSFVIEPNHLGRLLHAERYFCGQEYYYRLFYFVFCGLGCATFSIVAAWRFCASEELKGFWMRVLEMAHDEDAREVCLFQPMTCGVALTGSQVPPSKTKVHLLTLKPTIAHCRPRNATSEAVKSKLKMIVLSEGQALVFFALLTLWAEHFRFLNMVFLLPLAVKGFAYWARAKRRDVVFPEIKTDSAEAISFKAYVHPRVGMIAVRGPSSYTQQFDGEGIYGKAKLSALNGPWLRHHAEEASIFLAASSHVLAVVILLTGAMWQERDILPWMWLLAQWTATASWSVARIAGVANTGRTEHMLGEEMTTNKQAVLWAEGSKGVEAKLETMVVDTTVDATKAIETWLQSDQVNIGKPEYESEIAGQFNAKARERRKEIEETATGANDLIPTLEFALEQPSEERISEVGLASSMTTPDGSIKRFAGIPNDGTLVESLLERMQAEGKTIDLWLGKEPELQH